MFIVYFFKNGLLIGLKNLFHPCSLHLTWWQIMSFHLLGANLVKLPWLFSQTMSNQWVNLVSSTFEIHPKFNHCLLPSWLRPQASLIWVIFLAGAFCPYFCPTSSFLNRVPRVVILKHKSNYFTSLLQHMWLFTISSQFKSEAPTVSYMPFTIWSCYPLVPFSVSPPLRHSLQTVAPLLFLQHIRYASSWHLTLPGIFI